MTFDIVDKKSESSNDWEDFFIIPDKIQSIESLQESITFLEISILENWIFNKIIPIIGHLFPTSDELFASIKKLTQHITQNQQPCEIDQDILDLIKPVLDYQPTFEEEPQLNFTDLFKNILGSLSQNIPKEVAEIADVHAIIQASGFSTQNEHSHLAILDFVNYVKYTEEIKNIKFISSAFVRPLLPLYWEMVYISKQPKNILNIIRLILPLILLTAYLIAIETLFSTVPVLMAFLSLLHAPEVAMILTMVISIYMGLVLLSYAYENIKMVHQSLTNFYYGGLYQTPIYQVNQRMISMFGEDLSKKISVFYTEHMQKLDGEIKPLEDHRQHSGLNEQDIQLLKIFQETRKKLELEWMSVHHLTNYATNQAKKHVKNRLQQTIKEKYETFTQTRTKDLKEFPQIIKNQLTNSEYPCSLFQPKCLEIKKEIENLQTIHQSMN